MKLALHSVLVGLAALQPLAAQSRPGPFAAGLAVQGPTSDRGSFRLGPEFSFQVHFRQGRAWEQRLRVDLPYSPSGGSTDFELANYGAPGQVDIRPAQGTIRRRGVGATYEWLGSLGAAGRGAFVILGVGAMHWTEERRVEQPAYLAGGQSKSFGSIVGSLGLGYRVNPSLSIEGRFVHSEDLDLNFRLWGSSGERTFHRHYLTLGTVVRF